MKKTKTIPKTFCVMPFLSGNIRTTGDYNVCCNSINTKNYNIKRNSYREWLQSKERLDLQKDFLNGERPKACSRCWTEEDENRSSLRILKNKEHKLDRFKTFESFEKVFGNDVDPIEMEMQVTNLCNLKCAMCVGSDSSKLLVENKSIYKTNKFKLNDIEKNELTLNQKEFDVTRQGLENLYGILDTNLKVINFRGGETFMIPGIKELLKSIIKSGKSNNLLLHITTNCTLADSEIIEMLASFKKVRLMLSIEATGKQNDYIRFPSKWDSIKENIGKFKKIPNCQFFVHTVITNLNLLYADQLIDFSIKNNFFTKLEITRFPDYMHFSVLPKTLLQKSLSKLETLHKKIQNFDQKIDNYDTLLLMLRDAVKTYDYKKDKWEKFKEIMKARDNFRHVNMIDFLPELGKEIYTT